MKNKTQIIALIGLSKNAGKTSYLNWFLNQNHSKTIGVTTTGHDGRELQVTSYKLQDTSNELQVTSYKLQDTSNELQVTSYKLQDASDELSDDPNTAVSYKPRVSLKPNTYFTSFDYVLNQNPALIKVIKKLPFRVNNKNLWLYKTLGNITTEIVGARTLSEQEKLISIFEENECEQIIIDGAIDRKIISLSEKITDIILIIGAAAGNLKEIIEQAELIRFYSKLERITIDDYKGICYELQVTSYKLQDMSYELRDTAPTFVEGAGGGIIKSVYSNEAIISDIVNQNPEWIYFPGSLTEVSYKKLQNKLLNYKGKIIFNHPLNIQIPLKEIKKMNNLYVRTNFLLKTIAVNSFSPQNEHIDADILRNEIKKIFDDIPVIDVTHISIDKKTHI